MSVFQKIVGTMLGLIALYLLLSQSSGAKTVIQSLGEQSGNLFKTLQGR
jgi:hypothetical protein